MAANNKDADQTVGMRRLICTFVVRIWQKQIISWRGSYCIFSESTDGSSQDTQEKDGSVSWLP